MKTNMTWEEICKTHPNSFVLLKNFQKEIAKSGKIRVLSGEVVFSSPNSKEVYHQYHAQKSQHEVVFGYTGWKVFEIEERPFLGIRPSYD